jgi:hypothetical protein
MWLIVSGDFYIEGDQPNVELFLNATLALTVVGALLIRKRRSNAALIVALGLLMGLGTLYKHVFVAPAGLLLLAHGLFPPAGIKRIDAIMQSVAMGSIMVSAWGLLFAYFWATGHFQDFYDAMITFNRAYAGSIGSTVFRLDVLTQHNRMLLYSRPFARLLGNIINTSLGRDLLLLAMAPLCSALLAVYHFGLSARSRVVLIAWTIGSYIAYAMPGRYYAHYYQLLPPAEIVCVCAMLQFFAAWPGVGVAFVPKALALAMIAAALAIELPLPWVDQRAWIEATENGRLYAESMEFGTRLNQILLPKETLFAFGEQPGLFFYSGRPASSGITYVEPAVDGPLVGPLSLRLQRELMSNPPDLFVIYQEESRFLFGRPYLGFHQWIRKTYRFAKYEVGDRFILLTRRGSALDARMHPNNT